jgi:hypothetical protein
MALVADLNRERLLGVEHEFSAVCVGNGSGMDVQRSIAEVLSANGIASMARGYDHSPFSQDIAVEYDSSVHGTSEWRGVRHFPIELKTRPLTYGDYERIVPNALKIAQYMGGRANHSCGYHVHVGLPEFKHNPRVARSLYNAAHRYQNVILACQPPSRRENNYCRALPSAGRFLHGANSLNALRSKLSQLDRFYWLNLTNLWADEPHVEFRVFAGTLDPTRAAMTVRLCLQLVQHAVTRNCQGVEEPLSNNRKGIEALLIGCGFKVNTKVYSKVSSELRETSKWLLKRWKHWNVPNADGSQAKDSDTASDDRAGAVREEAACAR